MKLFYRSIGKGEPVVIIHGLYGSSDNWMTIARKLSETHRVIAGPIELDVDSLQVIVSGTPLDLTHTEFKLLQALMAAPGKVFSRNELIQRVQGYDFDGYDRTIDSHIKNLRKKIARYLPDQEVIRTVYGVGYTFKLPPD